MNSIKNYHSVIIDVAKVYIYACSNGSVAQLRERGSTLFFLWASKSKRTKMTTMKYTSRCKVLHKYLYN